MMGIFRIVQGIVKLRGGSDGTLIGNVSDALKVTGSISSAPGYGSLQTYAASFTGIVPVAGVTDFITIQGSATKVVKIIAIHFTCTTTAGSGFTANATIAKRSSANTGGTSSTLTNVSKDSANAAATAVIKAYSANPSALGTLVGNLFSTRLSIFTVNNSGIPSTLANLSEIIPPAQPITLRGTSEFAALNLGGITITSPVASGTVIWTEE